MDQYCPFIHISGWSAGVHMFLCCSLPVQVQQAKPTYALLLNFNVLAAVNCASEHESIFPLFFLLLPDVIFACLFVGQIPAHSTGIASNLLPPLLVKEENLVRWLPVSHWTAQACKTKPNQLSMAMCRIFEKIRSCNTHSFSHRLLLCMAGPAESGPVNEWVGDHPGLLHTALSPHVVMGDHFPAGGDTVHSPQSPSTPTVQRGKHMGQLAGEALHGAVAVQRCQGIPHRPLPWAQGWT